MEFEKNDSGVTARRFGKVEPPLTLSCFTAVVDPCVESVISFWFSTIFAMDATLETSTREEQLLEHAIEYPPGL